MSKLAVVFPGIGYTVDKPLLHYSRRLAADAGYEIKLLPYAGFPKKVKGDKGRMADSYRIALEQSKEMLSETDFSVYEEILFIGKSIGTIVAAQLASESPVSSRIRLVLYTPLKETFSFPFGEALVFTGSADPWVQSPDEIPQACREREIVCHVIPDANHSLETGDVQRDIRNMQGIMEKTGRFIREEAAGSRQQEKQVKIVLEPLSARFSVCKVPDYSGIDLMQPFCFTGKKKKKKSLVCPEALVPDHTSERDDGWKGFRIIGQLDFSLIGILARISGILASNGIGIFAVSTFNTDYIFTKEENFDKALEVLKAAGYEIRGRR